MSTITEIVSPSTPRASPAPEVIISLEPQSVPSTRSPSPEVDDHPIEVNNNPILELLKQKARLNLVEKAVEIYKVTAALEAKIALVKELESETNDELQALAAKYADIKKGYEAMEGRLRQQEGEKQNHVLAAEMYKGDVDKINLRKAELEIMKLKSSMVETEIEMMELDVDIKAKSTQKSGTTVKTAVVQGEIDTIKQQLTELKDAHAKAKVDFDDKYGTSSVANNEDFQRLNNALNAMKAFADSQAKQINVLKSVCSMNGLAIPDTASFGEATNGVTDTASHQQLLEENLKLKEKIEQLTPLYWIGHATRNRYVEWELKHLRNARMNEAVNDEGMDAYRLAKPQADASLYMDFCERQRLAPEEYEVQYGVFPSVVWEHRKFCVFMNMIGWKQDMRKFRSAYQSESFNANFNKLFNRIVPRFEISSDEQVRKHDDLMLAYFILEGEHAKAIEAEKNAKARRSNSRY